MTPAQAFCQVIWLYFLNHWPFFIVLGFMSLFGSQFYEKWFRTNRETDGVDLMGRYMWLQLRRKYGRVQS